MPTSRRTVAASWRCPASLSRSVSTYPRRSLTSAVNSATKADVSAFGGRRRVSATPAVQFGLTCIEGTRLTTRTIFDVAEAGDDPAMIARSTKSPRLTSPKRSNGNADSRRRGRARQRGRLLPARRESSAGFGEALRLVGYNTVSNTEVNLRKADDRVVITFCSDRQVVWFTQDMDARKKAAYAGLVKERGVSAVFLAPSRAKRPSTKRSSRSSSSTFAASR